MKNMKYFFSCFILLNCFSGIAQQKPQHTQYVLNNYLINPAITGIENYTDAKISFRKQWTGIEGAPTTTYVSLHKPLGKKDERMQPTSFSKQGYNPRGNQYWSNYEVAPSHHGIGIIAMADNAGYLTRNSVTLNYAYHQNLTTKMAISVGAQLGISNVYLDREKIVWATLDPNDPAIGYSNGELRKVTPEIGVGLWLYSDKLYFGSSVLNIIPKKIRYVSDSKYGSLFNPHFYATAGYRIQATEDLNILPSVLLLYTQPDPIQIQSNVKIQYRDFFWFGGGYRFSDALGGINAIVGANFLNTFNIAYAYDAATTSRLRTYAKNTHEVILGFLIGNTYGDSCPKNIW
jgi:type IX secretion system PorP/SprF family membrane protein